jgi:hypothetical protein
MYPHDALPDDVYARVGQRLAEAACQDPGAEGSDFFELVRSTAVVEVYSDQRTWRLVGYEGPSFDQDGYLHRRFNDLDWLPDPEAAS